MTNEMFKKEAFKKSVKDNVKFLYRKTIEEAKKEVGMVIEGLDNIEVAHKLSKIHNIEMPIVDAVYDVLYNDLAPEIAVKMLMTRDKKAE